MRIRKLVNYKNELQNENKRAGNVLRINKPILNCRFFYASNLRNRKMIKKKKNLNIVIEIKKSYFEMLSVPPIIMF